MKITIDDKTLEVLPPEEKCVYVYLYCYPDKSLREISADLNISFYKVQKVFKLKNQSKINHKINQKSISETPINRSDAREKSIKNQSQNQSKINHYFVKYKGDDLCIKWQNKLYNDLIEYADEYSKQMIQEFYQYWNEPNKSHTDCRWHMQLTWDLAHRLRTWSSRKNKKSSVGVVLHDNTENKYDNDDKLWNK